jgi:signal transduction histidine kinase
MPFIFPEDREHVLMTQAQVANGICPEPFEYRIRRSGGEVRQLRRITELIRDKDGNVTAFGGTVLDVTELRAAERRQRDLEQQLAHSQKLEALGTLAGGIAHDLNNTLVPILSLAKLALMDLPEGSELRQDLETISASSERARDLVKQILAFSRKQNSNKALIDPATGAARTLQMLRASLPANIALVEKIAAVPQIFADAVQLEQVLVNLVTNAAQAIGLGSGVITVEIARAYADPRAARPEFVRLAVADTGCGIDNQTVKRIFEPFFTTKDVGEGTGLGLALVHGIVTGHGGTIHVASEPGNGTVFTVLLPAAEKNELLEAAA